MNVARRFHVLGDLADSGDVNPDFCCNVNDNYHWLTRMLYNVGEAEQ